MDNRNTFTDTAVVGLSVVVMVMAFLGWSMQSKVDQLEDELLATKEKIIGLEKDTKHIADSSVHVEPFLNLRKRVDLLKDTVVELNKIESEDKDAGREAEDTKQDA